MSVLRHGFHLDDGGEGGKFYSPDELAKQVFGKWPSNAIGQPLVVCTGGEPALQIDDALVASFHTLGSRSPLKPTVH